MSHRRSHKRSCHRHSQLRHSQLRSLGNLSILFKSGKYCGFPLHCYFSILRFTFLPVITISSFFGTFASSASNRPFLFLALVAPAPFLAPLLLMTTISAFAFAAYSVFVIILSTYALFYHTHLSTTLKYLCSYKNKGIQFALQFPLSVVHVKAWSFPRTY